MAQKPKFKFSDLKKSANKEVDLSGIDPEYLDTTLKDPQEGALKVKKSTRRASIKSEPAPQPKLYEDMTDFKKQISNLVDMYADIQQKLANHIMESKNTPVVVSQHSAKLEDLLLDSSEIDAEMKSNYKGGQLEKWIHFQNRGVQYTRQTALDQITNIINKILSQKLRGNSKMTNELEGELWK